MILTKELITDIRNMAEHYLDSIDDFSLKNEYERLFNLLTDVPRRFEIEIKRKERVPFTEDVIINTMVHHIFDLYDADENTCEEENALWMYLFKIYSFDAEGHPLEKCTFEEAISYAVKKLDIVSR